MYGLGYIGHPRLEKLMEKNNVKSRDFMTGRQEADAFQAKRYVDLHRSTLRKVDVLCNLAQRAHEGALKTNSSWSEIHGISPASLGELIQQHPLYAALSVLSTVGGVLGLYALF